MALTPYTGSFGTPELRHLLRRTLFGCSNADLAAFSGQSLSQVVTSLLNVPTAASAPPLNAYQAFQVDPDCGLGATWINGTTLNSALSGSLVYERYKSLRSWWIGNIINQDRTIAQKMLFLWFNHIPTDFQGNVDDPIITYKYLELLRQYSLGNFKAMVLEISKSPAMLMYLDGRYNTKWGVNENYARELQELFTIGKDLPAYYTEDDVKAAARCLTGWKINDTTRTSYFDNSLHTTTNKVFSAFYNNTTIVGVNSATAGDTELNALLNMIFANNEVANYVVRKIYRHFVYYKIDSTIETNIIIPLANTFRSNGYNILPIMQELLTSQHFFDAQSVGCYLKNPLDFVLGFIRTFGVNTTNADLVNQYKNWNYFYDRCNEQDLNLGFPPNVAGYPAYYQAPNYHELWAIPDNLRDRHNFINTFVSSNYNGMFFDMLAFTNSIPNASDPNALIDAVLTMSHTIDSDTALKTSLKAILLNNLVGDFYWTTAWSNYVANPANTSNTNTVKTRLKNFYKAVFTMAEAHLC